MKLNIWWEGNAEAILSNSEYASCSFERQSKLDAE